MFYTLVWQTLNQNYEVGGLYSNTSLIKFLNVTRDGSIGNIGVTDDSVVEVEYLSIFSMLAIWLEKIGESIL